ncbi:MAG TPA: condensation domain-containing protein [Gordonia sp. (in: high G+C Gram-positive bacteria)]|nr:condensation domain-containing protein [Gordonia sp. (in: high G+C Gram-positive bacteria)]HRC52096.1 condensation domain-containing protein [Gordonia sp. (in: high G+C Gram-positive bacteria)]
MRAAVLDSRLLPTPVGVVGELYLSGAQLTRGYLGRPGQTATRFVADPARPGQRMYRTGDLVRWSGEGNLEFVGRSDDQVKIRGYRIELGEVEAGLRRVPGVRTAAVLATPRPTGAALVGFVVGAEGPELDAATVRRALGRQVPAHMVPARIVCLPALPMMSNGKLDAKALADSAAAAFADHVDGEKPATDTEHAVAAAIADMLGTAPGVTDDLFDYGLDSIVAMAVVNALRNQGHRIAARDILAHSTIRDAAAAVDRAAAIEAVVAAREYGTVDPLPVVEWMYEYGNYRRFTQTALLALPATVSDEELVSVLQAVIDAHDMLRATVVDGSVVTRAPGAVDAHTVLAAASGPDLAALITPAARAANDRIDPDTGAMLAATRLRAGEATDIVLLAIHHIATDAVSWQVLFTDLFEAGLAIAGGATPDVTPEFTDYRRWCRLLTERANSTDVDAQRDYWRDVVAGIDPAFGSRKPDPTSDTWASLASEIALTEQDVTAAVLARIDRRIGMREFLLAALTVTLTSWRTRRGDDPTGGAFIALEGHGREDHVLGSDDSLVDTARTLGWFTTVFPVRLGAGDDWVDLDRLRAQPSLAVEVIDAVADRVAAIPNTGMDFGLLKYTASDEVLRAAEEPQVEFNYLGRFDLGVPGGGFDAGDPAWAPVTDLALNEHLPIDPEPDLPLRYTLDVVSVVRATADGPQLVTNWRYGSDLLDAAQARELADLWLAVVTELVRGWGADDEAAD